MLSIRMQRTGRKGHAMFRVIVQESRLTPTSGKVVAFLGSYDPHAKTVTLNKDKAQTFLNNGAQPSERAALLLQKEGVKLPSWVKLSSAKSGSIRHPEKLRRNNPVEQQEEPAAEAVSEEAATEAHDAAEPTTKEVAPDVAAAEAEAIDSGAEKEAAPAESESEATQA